MAGIMLCLPSRYAGNVPTALFTTFSTEKLMALGRAYCLPPISSPSASPRPGWSFPPVASAGLSGRVRYYSKAPLKKKSQKTETQLPVDAEQRKRDLFARLRTYDHLTPVFDLMKRYSITPTTSICNSLIHFYADDNNLEVAAKVLSEMKENGVPADVTSYNHLFQGYYDRADSQSFFSLWTSMKEQQIRGDKTTYRLLLRLAKTRPEFNSIIARLVKEYKEDRSMIDAIIESALKGYSKSGDSEKPVLLFYVLGPNGHHPTENIYNIMIEVMAKTGKKQEALRFFESMKDRKFFPNTSACNVLINIYGEEGAAEKVKLLEDEMNTRKVALNTVTTLMVDVYSREITEQHDEDSTGETTEQKLTEEKDGVSIS